MGKSLSTFISAALQHSSASRRCHSFTETVNFTSLSFLGLIGSFHSISPNYAFFLFSGDTAGTPTRTSTIITHARIVRHAILLGFSLLFFALFCGIAGADRQDEILEFLIRNIFRGEGGYALIKRKYDFLFRQRFYGV